MDAILPPNHQCSEYDTRIAYTNSKVQTSIQKWIQRSEAQARLEKPNKKFKRIKIDSSSLAVGNAGEAHTCGYRSVMEDTSCAFNMNVQLKGRNTAATVYALFDGHGMSTFFQRYKKMYDGLDCAQFYRDNLGRVLKKSLEEFWVNGLDCEISNAMKIALVALDEEYRQYIIQNPDYDASCLGTTATIALIFRDKFCVANVGDSRILVSQPNHMHSFTYDAKAGDILINGSVPKRGGLIRQNRVFSKDAYNQKPLCLAISRACGDHCFNVNGIKTVTSRPNIIIKKLDKLCGDHNYIILACDGVFDVASSSQVSKLVQELSQEDVTPKKIAKEVVRAALTAGSKDNISVMIVPLP